MPDDSSNGDDEQSQQSGQSQQQADDLRSMDKDELVDIILELRGQVRGLGGSVEAMQAVATAERKADAESLAEQAEAVEPFDGELAESLRARATDLADVDDIEDLDVEVV